MKRWVFGVVALLTGCATVVVPVSSAAAALPPPNRAPAAPTPIAPDDGAAVSTDAVITSTLVDADPDRDATFGTVHVYDAAGGTLALTVPTTLAPYGTSSSGATARLPTLPFGRDTWTAAAVDASARSSPVAGPSAFSVA